MTYGVTNDGFVPKPLSAIVDDFKTRARLAFGATVDLTSASPYMKFINSIAYEHALLWNLLEDVYYSGYLETAEGRSLESVVALLGITRNPATAAIGEVTFSLAAGYANPVDIPVGTVVSNADESVQFQTTEAATLTPGAPSVSVPVQAVTPGASGNLDTGFISKMVTPVSGIGAVANITPFTGGSDRENDIALRVRAANYSFQAKATYAALRGAILDVDGVMDVNLTENLLACTVQASVLGGADADITEAIEDTRACGIEVSWGRPTPVTLTFTANVTGVAGYTESDVQTAVETAIQGYLDLLIIGDSVYFSNVVNAILNAPQVSRLNALSFTDGTDTVDGFGAAIAIASTEKAVYGAAAVTVV